MPKMIRIEPKKTLIAIQQEFIDTVNGGRARWAHRKNGGHSGRIYGGAYNKAAKQLKKWGFGDREIKQLIKDANDMAKLQYDCQDE